MNSKIEIIEEYITKYQAQNLRLKKLLSDPNYAHYLEKFPKPKEKISRPYNCKAYIVKDSTAVDSTAISTENQATATPAL